MSEFILVTQKSVKGGESVRRIINVKDIISVSEIGNEVTVEMERDKNGRIRVGVPIEESFIEVMKKLEQVDKK